MRLPRQRSRGCIAQSRYGHSGKYVFMGQRNNKDAVCFGWIIVHDAIEFWQNSNTAVGLSAESSHHTNFGGTEKAIKRCETQRPDIWAVAHEKQVSPECTNALGDPHCQNKPLTS